MKGQGKTVFVGLSGGVDSSVAAARLLAEGYRVVGVFIRVWHPDFIRCTEEDERLDAMRVAAKLEIPFLTFDAQDVYKREVADYMIREYERGRTPNPDIMCNKAVKFGAFYAFAREHGADFVATGHYAQVKTEAGRLGLFTAVDTEKDQTYFLWTLSPDMLPHVLFPIGDTEKEQVRKDAKHYGLPTATKPDSQGICFLGKVDMKDFLSHYIQTESGSVLDERGVPVGTHPGAALYTIGERHRSPDSTAPVSTPQYVIAKNVFENTITVATEKPRREGISFVLEDINLIAPYDVLKAKYSALSVRTRYRGPLIPAELVDEDGAVVIRLLATSDVPSTGQSAVLYAGGECLGGGIIGKVL